MDNDVAVFLDVDNLVIGAGEADLPFDINLVLDHIKSLTDGRVVLRRAYGDWRQKAALTKELAATGFELQSTVRLSSNSKNLADMQLVVDAMSTLIDRQNFDTYVLISGDRDFAPLVQSLRKRGKKVIGVGVRHSVSSALAALCDNYIYYDELADSARKMLDEQLEELLVRALDQLLQENERVAASLLKQRMQALSKGSFGRAPQGKRNFRKLLASYPDIVELEQVGTTLFLGRAGSASAGLQDLSQRRSSLPEQEVISLLSNCIDELTQDVDRVRASLLKQQMQDESDGAFDETLQGNKNFRQFLERYPQLVAVDQDGSTLYVRKATPDDDRPEIPPILNDEDAKLLLQSAMDRLLAGQNRVRASLLKQEMQDLSKGTFDETKLGYENFRRFLERFPTVVAMQQKGTTLLIFKPEMAVEPIELNVRYRTGLKKHGLRVVPADIRLKILKDIIQLLSIVEEVPWQTLVNRLYGRYQSDVLTDISKSFINDVLRVARRARVVSVGEGGSLSSATVQLLIQGERQFQNAVMMCDITYLIQLRSLQDPFDWDEAAIALYDTTARSRYLQVIHSRFSGSDGNYQEEE